MKALLLCGGRATRLRPLSFSMPKQLVPVANKPVISHGLETVRGFGVTEVGIVVGTWADAIAEEVGDGSDYGLRVTYLKQNEPLGLAHGVVVARDFLGDDDFVMYLGDNVIMGDLSEAAADFERNHPDAQLVVTHVPNPSAHGLAEVTPDGQVLCLPEKPAVPTTDLAVMGVFFFTSAIHKAVRSIQPSERGELEITHAIEWLIDGGSCVRATTFSGYWKDTGTVEGLLDCNTVMLDTLERRILGSVDSLSEATGRVVVERGARIRSSQIVGPAVVGASSLVEDSRIGPYTSLGASCVVTGTGIERSIVCDGGRLKGIGPLHDSLIGPFAEVRGVDPQGAGHRLIVGEWTTVDIAGGPIRTADRGSWS
ncbi:glucose-1-phosphate thymidylyltransferase [Streptomyces sp. NPDC127084]|uniref:glucose-1-phosphate thymidylyltransferase n=1 Tax=Streptomyces sp. NPDC127084 TaxID=3347133 RepID=UPI00365F1806